MNGKIDITCGTGETMDCNPLLENPDFKKAVDFHGHMCPGLAIGFRAAKAALDFFGATRSEDEELVAVVENDACGVDAVQALTGCTFGKGNLIFRDYGKQVFYFTSRKTNKTVRIALRGDLPNPDGDKHAELIRRVRADEATPDEMAQFKELHKKRVCRILAEPVEMLFSIAEVNEPIPEKARLARSEPCERCGEPTMATKLEIVDGKKICRECLSK